MPTDIYQEICRVLQPWFPNFATLLLSAEEKQLQAIGALGVPRPGERATFFHCAQRTVFRAWCDETSGLFRLVEERDGLGTDYIVCNLIEGRPFAIRLGRYNGHNVKR